MKNIKIKTVSKEEYYDNLTRICRVLDSGKIDTLNKEDFELIHDVVLKECLSEYYIKKILLLR